MARIKTIWGPQRTLRHKHCISWTFTGVRADGTQAEWSLRLYFDTREFKTRAVDRGVQPLDVRQVTLQLPEIARAEVKVGLVTPMLRALLKPHHIAEATRLALEWQRKRP
jgi:uncharacterized protein HemX